MILWKDLSPRWKRHLTPPALCWWLVNRVALLTGAPRVAVLWVHQRSFYWHMRPQVECWTELQDARAYAGPWPIVAHPLCGGWGVHATRSGQPQDHGVRAMDLVHRWGGVVEQPVGSSLFREHGDGRRVERISQGAWGFPTPKPTLLYWCLENLSPPPQ